MKTFDGPKPFDCAFSVRWLSGLLGVLLCALAACPTSSCSATGGATTSPATKLSEMTRSDFERFSSNVSNVVSVAVGIALDRGALTTDDQATLAALVSMLATGELHPAPGGPLSSLLDDAGLTDNEVRGAFLLAERLLVDAGVAFGGEAGLGERAAGVLRALSEAIASARASP